MSEVVNQLASQTGISSDLVHKGLGALLSFLKKELGDETFDKLKNSVPDAGKITDSYEESPETPPAQGNLLEMVSGLAGKLLGGKAGASADLMGTLSKLGFNLQEIESFLPKALELLKSYLSPELVQRVLAGLPALAKLLTPEAKEKA
jgi:hypothetical protein